MANEKRLIDANACLHDMCKRCNIENEGCPCEPADCFIYNVLENSPTVDAVEVVRCKDCKYRHTEDCMMQYTDYSEDMDANPEGISVEWCEDNDFCSYGERREDGKE